MLVTYLNFFGEGVFMNKIRSFLLLGMLITQPWVFCDPGTSIKRIVFNNDTAADWVKKYAELFAQALFAQNISEVTYQDVAEIYKITQGRNLIDDYMIS